MTRGQASVEVLVAVCLILIFLVMGVSKMLEINSFSDSIASTGMDSGECLRLSQIIQEVFIQGPGTQIVIDSPVPFSVFPSSVEVNHQYCFFSGQAFSGSFSEGTIRIFNKSGVVGIENQ